MEDTDESNSSKKVELGEIDVEPDEEDDFLLELEDIDEEEVILYLEDFMTVQIKDWWWTIVIKNRFTKHDTT